ncbi:MAG: cache domain-containing protein, partial [Chloroflexota bacterium]|nr:cache domain-containing protein [Chloroflexota bacterium]
YEYVYLLDTDGLVLVSIQREGLPSIEGNFYWDRNYFLQAREGNTYIDALVGRSSKQLGFYFTAPVFDAQNDVVGVVAIKLKGDAITDVINTFNEKSGSVSAFLVDYQGIVVSAPTFHPQWHLQGLAKLSPDDKAEAEKRFVMDTPLSYIGIPELGVFMGADSGIVDYDDPENDQSYIVGHQVTENLNWVVGVTMPSSEFMTPILKLVLRVAIGGVILMGIVAFMAIRLARGIARPVTKLAGIAQDVEEDKPFNPENISDVMALGDEIGHLARVFSNMVLALRARMAELQTIYEIGNKISSNIELTDTLSDVIDSLSNVIDFDAAEICLYNRRKENLSLYLTNNEIMSADETVTKHTYDPDKDYFPHLLEERHGLLVQDIVTFEEYILTTQRSWDMIQPKSYLGVSLRDKGNVVGTIEMVNSSIDGFNQDNLRILESISIQAAVAISNAREVKERERRLKNMEIVVDESKVDEHIHALTNSDFFQTIKEKAKQRRS